MLSTGPYSAVQVSDPDWLQKSQVIRKYHECTHFICRNLYPEKTDAVRDELIADAIGIYAAYGRYDANLARLFLGIKDGKYTGGRLENYVSSLDSLSREEQLNSLAAGCDRAIEAIRLIFQQHENAAPFELIPALVNGPW